MAPPGQRINRTPRDSAPSSCLRISSSRAACRLAFFCSFRPARCDSQHAAHAHHEKGRFSVKHALANAQAIGHQGVLLCQRSNKPTSRTSSAALSLFMAVITTNGTPACRARAEATLVASPRAKAMCVYFWQNRKKCERGRCSEQRIRNIAIQEAGVATKKRHQAAQSIDLFLFGRRRDIWPMRVTTLPSVVIDGNSQNSRKLQCYSNVCFYNYALKRSLQFIGLSVNMLL